MPTYHSMHPPKIILSQRVNYAAQKDIYAFEPVSGKIQHRYSLQGFTNPTIVNGIIYVNHYQTSIVQALRVSDGVQLWNYKVDGLLCLSPIVANDAVYISTNEGNVYALRATSGTLLWQYKTSPLLIAPPTVYGAIAYLASAGNSPSHVFIPVSSAALPSSEPTLYALQTSDGTCCWQTPFPASTSFPLAIRDEHIYMTTQEECIALRIKDGSLLWRHKINGFCRSEPIVTSKIVLFSYSIFQVARDRTNPTQIKQWQDTFLCALSASDGSQCWQQALRIDREGSNSIAHNLSTKGANEISSPLGNDPTVPFVAEHTVYVGVGGTLLAFKLDNGRPLWHYYTEGTFLSTPQASNGVVYVGANDGNVYALRIDSGTLLWRTYLE